MVHMPHSAFPIRFQEGVNASLGERPSREPNRLSLGLASRACHEEPGNAVVGSLHIEPSHLTTPQTTGIMTQHRSPLPADH